MTKLTFQQRCQRVGLYEGSLFTWLDKVEQLTEENARLTKTNREQATQIEMMRRGFKDIIQTAKQSVISYGCDKAHTRNIDTANGALTLSTTPAQALEAARVDGTVMQQEEK